MKIGNKSWVKNWALETSMNKILYNANLLSISNYRKKIWFLKNRATDTMRFKEDASKTLEIFNALALSELSRTTLQIQSEIAVRKSPVMKSCVSENNPDVSRSANANVIAFTSLEPFSTLHFALMFPNTTRWSIKRSKTLLTIGGSDLSSQFLKTGTTEEKFQHDRRQDSLSGWKIKSKSE